MVLLELITRKKIGENGFARRTPAKLFALEAEDVRQESPPDAPDSLLSLAIMWVHCTQKYGLYVFSSLDRTCIGLIGLIQPNSPEG